MKFLLALLFVGAVTADMRDHLISKRTPKTETESCPKSASECCDDANKCEKSCSSLIIGSEKYVDLSAYANENLARSFEYLFLSAQFGTFSKDRPGFEKVFHGLADKAWANGIEMIKEVSKRGAKHSFGSSVNTATVSAQPNLDEISAMGKAAEIEKNLLMQANNVHRHHSHASSADSVGKEKGYDAGVSHYIEEEIIEGKTETVRTLVGYVNDLMKLRKNNEKDFSLSLYLFDQYLQK